MFSRNGNLKNLFLPYALNGKKHDLNLCNPTLYEVSKKKLHYFIKNVLFLICIYKLHKSDIDK